MSLAAAKKCSYTYLCVGMLHTLLIFVELCVLRLFGTSYSKM